MNIIDFAMYVLLFVYFNVSNVGILAHTVNEKYRRILRFLFFEMCFRINGIEMLKVLYTESTDFWAYYQ